MIIKKLGARLLTAILGLTLVLTQVIYATQDNICPPGKTCKSINILKHIELRLYFVDTYIFSEVPIGYVDELHIKKNKWTACTIELLYVNKKGQYVYTGNIIDYPIYIYFYNSHGQKIWDMETFANRAAIKRLLLPQLDRGNYTLKFIYHCSHKHHLLPCTKTIPSYVE